MNNRIGYATAVQLSNNPAEKKCCRDISAGQQQMKEKSGKNEKEMEVDMEERTDDWKEGSEWESGELEKLKNKFSTDRGTVLRIMQDVWKEERSIGEDEINGECLIGVVLRMHVVLDKKNYSNKNVLFSQD